MPRLVVLQQHSVPHPLPWKEVFMGARNKLNWMQIQLGLVIAVMAGALFGSWLASVIVMAIFLALAFKGRGIR
jgi:hypothetical protein